MLRNLLPVDEEELYINLTGTSKITAKVSTCFETLITDNIGIEFIRIRAAMR